MTIRAKAIIFDMDGVLVDSEELMCQSAIAALSEWGIQATPSDFTPFIGAGEDKFIGGVSRCHGVDYATAMKDRAYTIYGERAASANITFKNVTETLRRIQAAGLRFGICSGADKIKVDINIRTLGLTPEFFDFIVTGRDVTHNKPDPEIYLLGLKRLGLPASDCIVIEDSLNGIRAGQRAGIRTIAVTSSFSREEIQSQVNPTAIIDTISELPEIVSLG